jgi:hypothetical protein
MRTFQLVRDEDVSGVSGVGVVALGVEFDDGTVALRWASANPTSVVFHDRGMASVKAVHGHGGATRIVLDRTADRLGRIAEAHCKHLTTGGMTSGDCAECGWTWPCPTYTWATSDRDPLACWNPDDDEAAADVH